MTKTRLISVFHDLYHLLSDNDGCTNAGQATTEPRGQYCFQISCQQTLRFFLLHSLQLYQLRSLTLLNGQQPQEPLGSWQQVAPSGHRDRESGQMTPVSPLPTWIHHKQTHTQDLEGADRFFFFFFYKGPVILAGVKTSKVQPPEGQQEVGSSRAKKLSY